MIYSYQLFHLSENTFQQFNLIENPSRKYRILINNTEGEGNICFNQICDNDNSFIHLTEQKIYSFSISNKTNFFIYAQNNLIFRIKIIHENINEQIKELNYQYNSDLNKEKFPLLYIIKDVKYKGININFIFKFNSSNNIYNNLVVKGFGIDYSRISSIKDKNDIKGFDFTNGIKGKFDNITNSGIIELSNDVIKTKYKDTYKYLDDKYFMIIIENITSFDFKNLGNEIYVFSKDPDKILLPINKYIRNSFNLLKNKNINQKYFFERENITTNNEFILEFSSNYENILLVFNNFTTNSTLEITEGFKQYVLSINSTNSSDYYFNVVIMASNKLDLDKALKEVNIIIKYYNKENKLYKINSKYIYNNFTLNTTNIKKEYSDYNLILNKNNKINNYSEGIYFIYYLRLIKKSNILDNEELNTTALVSSNLLYIDKINTTGIDNELSFNLSNLENNEKYIASVFIKIENVKEEEERYYSIIYEFNTKNIDNEDDTGYIWIIILIIILFLIIAFILILIWKKINFKSRSIKDKINEINFESGINKDINNNQELEDNERESGNFLQVFI